MALRYLKVNEIAERYRVSVDAVYLWIRAGKIPADCVVRIAGTARVDEEQFEKRLRSGALYHSRGRRSRTSAEPTANVSAEGNFTTVREGPVIQHRWTGETGGVQADHPFSPEMITTVKRTFQLLP